jgi:hypothetical protein
VTRRNQTNEHNVRAGMFMLDVLNRPGTVRRVVGIAY